MWSLRQPQGSSSGAALRSHEPPTASSALHELQSDMQSLETRVGKLAKGPLDDAEELLELRKPIESLDVDLAALRQAVRIRFEAVEEHVAALEKSSAALEECCDFIEKQRASENGVDADAVWPSARATPALSGRRVNLDPAGSSAGVALDGTHSVRSRVPENSSSRTRTYDAPVDISRRSLMEREPEQRSSRQRSSSPARMTRRRSRSPAPRSEAAFELGGSVQSRLRIEESSDALSTAPRGPRASFARPAWAAGVELQSEPLREGRDFVSVVTAIKAAYKYTLLEVDQPIEVRQIALQLRKLDSTLFDRHHVTKWKEFMPICQRFVAMFLVIPPAQHNVQLSSGDCILLEDTERPYFSRMVEPPHYKEQVAQLCTQIDLPMSAWVHRGNLAKNTFLAKRAAGRRLEPPSRPWGEPRSEVQPKPERLREVQDEPKSKQEPNLRSWGKSRLKEQPKAEPEQATQSRVEPGAILTTFPPLPGPVPVAWRSQFDDPTFYWVLVDVLRQSFSLSMHSNTLLTAMGRHIGEPLREMVTVCRGLKRLLGLASRFVKVGMLSKDPQIIILIDADRPFKEDQDNENYFARKKSRTHVVPSQQEVVHLRDDPTGWGGDEE